MIPFVLFDINMDAGHGGSPGRFSHLEELAKSYAFAIAAGIPDKARHR